MEDKPKRPNKYARRLKAYTEIAEGKFDANNPDHNEMIYINGNDPWELKCAAKAALAVLLK